MDTFDDADHYSVPLGLRLKATSAQKIVGPRRKTVTKKTPTNTTRKHLKK